MANLISNSYLHTEELVQCLLLNETALMYFYITIHCNHDKLLPF